MPPSQQIKSISFVLGLLKVLYPLVHSAWWMAQLLLCYKWKLLLLAPKTILLSFRFVSLFLPVLLWMTELCLIVRVCGQSFHALPRSFSLISLIPYLITSSEHPGTGSFFCQCLLCTVVVLTGLLKEDLNKVNHSEVLPPWAFYWDCSPVVHSCFQFLAACCTSLCDTVCREIGLVGSYLPLWSLINWLSIINYHCSSLISSNWE